MYTQTRAPEIEKEHGYLKNSVDPRRAGGAVSETMAFLGSWPAFGQNFAISKNRCGSSVRRRETALKSTNGYSSLMQV